MSVVEATAFHNLDGVLARQAKILSLLSLKATHRFGNLTTLAACVARLLVLLNGILCTLAAAHLPQVKSHLLLGLATM